MNSKFIVKFRGSKLHHIRFWSSSKDWIVERASSNDVEKIFNFIDKFYLKDEPLANSQVFGKHPEITRRVYKDSVDQGLSVIAREAHGNKEIIGINLNGRSHQKSNDESMEVARTVSDLGYRKLLETIAIIDSEANLNKKLCQKELFGLKLLSVRKKYWASGVSTDLLKKSIEVAREENFKFGKVICGNEFSKKYAEHFKMKLAWSEPYKTLLCRGEIPPRGFPEAPHNTAYLYYADMNDFVLPERKK